MVLDEDEVLSLPHGVEPALCDGVIPEGLGLGDGDLSLDVSRRCDGLGSEGARFVGVLDAHVDEVGPALLEDGVDVLDDGARDARDEVFTRRRVGLSFPGDDVQAPRRGCLVVHAAWLKHEVLIGVPVHRLEVHPAHEGNLTVHDGELLMPARRLDLEGDAQGPVV